MSLKSSTIDLTRLPPPDVVESLNFESLYESRKAALVALFPPAQQVEIAETLALESEPLAKLLQENVYRELTLRQRINEAAVAVMLPYARLGDLDALASNLGVERLPGEKDDRLRERTQLSLEGFSTAGPVGAYRFHALSSSVAVRDVSVDSPAPGTVRVTLLAEPTDDEPTGVPDNDMLAAVLADLSADDIRPLTDTVVVAPATVVDYLIDATIVMQQGPSGAVVLQAARQAAQAYADDQFYLGRPITVSGLKSALRRPGVVRVDLASPAMAIDQHFEDVLISVSPSQAARCSGITIAAEVMV